MRTGRNVRSSCLQTLYFGDSHALGSGTLDPQFGFHPRPPPPFSFCTYFETYVPRSLRHRLKQNRIPDLNGRNYGFYFPFTTRPLLACLSSVKVKSHLSHDNLRNALYRFQNAALPERRLTSVRRTVGRSIYIQIAPIKSHPHRMGV